MGPQAVSAKLPPPPRPCLPEDLETCLAFKAGRVRRTVFLWETGEVIHVQRAGDPPPEPLPVAPGKRRITQIEEYLADRIIVTMVEEWPPSASSGAQPPGTSYYVYGSVSQTPSGMALNADGKVLSGWRQTITEHPLPSPRSEQPDEGGSDGERAANVGSGD
jgi:hypothetical protein